MASYQVDDTDKVVLACHITGGSIINVTNVAAAELRGGNSDKYEFINARQPNSTTYGTEAKAIKYDDMPTRNAEINRDAEAFVQYASSILSALETGKNAVVFCKNGRSRSPSVVAAFYVIYRGISLREIEVWFKEVYPRHRPVTAEQSANNFPNIRKFWNVLDRLETCLADPKKTVEGFNLAESVAKCSKAHGITFNLAGSIKFDHIIDPLSFPPSLRQVYTSREHQSPGRVMTRGASRQEWQAVASADNTPASTHADNTAASSDALGIPDEDANGSEFSLSASQIHLPWAALWKEMRSVGWRYEYGNSTVSYYYIHPRWAGIKKKEVLRGKKKKGSDYFESEDEVRLFAKERLGWKGERILSVPGKTLLSTASTSHGTKNLNKSTVNIKVATAGEAQTEATKQLETVSEMPSRTHASKKNRDEEMGIPVKTVKFSGEEAEAKVKADTVGGQKGNLATPVADGLMNWGDMWTRMSEQGWGWMPGEGLVDWYYVHPTFAGRSKSEIMKNGKEGKDYFLKESVMRYAKKYLGFRGEVASPASNINDDQRRGRKRSAAVAATAEPIVEIKKKRRRKALTRVDKNSVVGKTQVSKTSKTGKKQANTTKVRKKKSDNISKVGKKQADETKGKKKTNFFPPFNADINCRTSASSCLTRGFSSSPNLRPITATTLSTLQDLRTSEIDTKIAPHQFCELLCLVNSSPNTDFAFTPGRAGPDHTVSVNKLWPALKFDSFNELMDQLKMDIDDPKSIKWTRITAKFTVAANKLATKAGFSMAKAGFAYLLGKGNQSANFLAILMKNDSGELIEDGVIFDFFDSVIEMESAEGYCASSEFQHAFKVAMARMEIKEGVEGSSDSMPVQVTSMNSAKIVSESNDLRGGVYKRTEQTVATAGPGVSTKEKHSKVGQQKQPVFESRENTSKVLGSVRSATRCLKDGERAGVIMPPSPGSITSETSRFSQVSFLRPSSNVANFLPLGAKIEVKSTEKTLSTVNSAHCSDSSDTTGEGTVSDPEICEETGMRGEVSTSCASSHTQVTNTIKKSPGRQNKTKAPCSLSSKQSSISLSSGESKKRFVPLSNQELSFKDELVNCKMMLKDTENLATTSDSEMLEIEIKLFMQRAMETGYEIDGMSAQSPGFMYICGGAGTGKTSLVAACLKEWASDGEFIKPCYCHMNLASNHAFMNTSEIKKQMLKSMAKKLEIDKKSSQAVFVNQFRKKGMILVIDEIDMLIKNQGGSGEQWFSTLIEWCEDKELPFSMIGISNSVNDINATKIRELSNTPHELFFPTYNKADLLAILEKRIGTKIVDTKALQLIAKRVAVSTGDARKALEITSNAVDNALDACAVKWLEEVEADSYPLVKLPEMMRAIREGMPTRHSENIRGLPQAAKVILCIAVSLGKVWGPTAAVSILTLKKYAVYANHHAILDDASLGQMTKLVEMLMDSGLLTANHDGCFNFDSNDHSSCLCIAVQLDDVEIAFEKSLLEESSFYRILVDYVKRECPHPEFQ